MAESNNAEELDLGGVFEQAEQQVNKEAMEGAAVMDWESISRGNDALSEMEAILSPKQPQEEPQQPAGQEQGGQQAESPEGDDDPFVQLRKSELQAMFREFIGQQEDGEATAQPDQEQPADSQQEQQQPAQDPQQQFYSQIVPDYELSDEEYNEAMESKEGFEKSIRKSQEAAIQRIMQALPGLSANIAANVYGKARLAEKFYDENPTMKVLPENKIYQEMNGILQKNPGLTSEKVLEKLTERLGPVSRLYAQAFQEQKKETPKRSNSTFASRGTNPRSPDKQEPSNNRMPFGNTPPTVSDIVFGTKGGR